MTGEHIRLLSDCESDLSKIENKINQNQTDSIVPFLIAYAVVRITGTYEVIFKEIIYNVTSQGATTEAKQFLENNIIESSANPSTGKIGSILQEVSSNWKQQFDTRVRNECSDGKEKLNQLVNFRNDFAHGRSFHISIQNTIASYHSSKRIFEILDEIVNQNVEH